MNFSHIKKKNIKMVDITSKKNTSRIAKASCSVVFQKKTFEKIIKDGSPKGEIINTAKLAGILGAKKTSELIPLSHNLILSSIDLDFKINKKKCSIDIFSIIKTSYKTGVEIEALTACSIAALTIYDMCKSSDKTIKINDLKLLFKSGGKSGKYENKIF